MESSDDGGTSDQRTHGGALPIATAHPQNRGLPIADWMTEFGWYVSAGLCRSGDLARYLLLVFQPEVPVIQKSVLPGAAIQFCALFVAAISMTANADEATVQSSRAEVEKVLRAAEKLFAAGANASAKELASLLYTPDVVIVGEGDAQAKRGIANAVTDVQAWYDWLGPDGQRTCTYTMTTPVVASGTMLAAFTSLHCGANPPAQPKEVEVRVLHVWNKGPQGWRVELEMWAPGKL